ncbi:Rossmann-fold NAD(P)-binding domain-containing protein [Lysobacter xanthus]
MRILIAGATGLVGQGVLAACRAAPDVERIVLLGRRRVDIDDPRIEQVVRPDLREVPASDLQGLDACLYCIGTVPGLSAAAFREVTVDLTVHIARVFAEANPGGTFVYVSGAGADPSSALMPLKVKGQAEAVLQTLGLRTLMVRPGIVQPVDGVRSPHGLRSVGYTIGGPLLGLATRALPRLMTTTTHVGRAMLAALREPAPPAVLENADLNRLGAASG